MTWPGSSTGAVFPVEGAEGWIEEVDAIVVKVISAVEGAPVGAPAAPLQVGAKDLRFGPVALIQVQDAVRDGSGRLTATALAASALER
jgi:hypothetical protein